MGKKEELRGRLRQKSKQARAAAEAQLSEDLQRLLQTTVTDLEKLRPRVSDAAELEKLIRIVADATQKNEDVASLKDRVSALGQTTLRMVSEVAKLMR